MAHKSVLQTTKPGQPTLCIDMNKLIKYLTLCQSHTGKQYDLDQTAS